MKDAGGRGQNDDAFILGLEMSVAVRPVCLLAQPEQLYSPYVGSANMQL
jgi:hypothetical protein